MAEVGAADEGGDFGAFESFAGGRVGDRLRLVGDRAEDVDGHGFHCGKCAEVAGDGAGGDGDVGHSARQAGEAGGGGVECGAFVVGGEFQGGVGQRG
ncbi:hypothetical protein WU86_03620 [Corynebacterium xerosis]|nr:hypothetical protein [Corynebacterium xerosis]KKO82349.1 hypothetical protein WU86_03620 [Corynebacterium xerosis]